MTLIRPKPAPKTAAAPKPMTAKAYVAALHKLGLGVAQKRTAALLGISIGHSLKIQAGHPVPVAIQHLLEAWLHIGRLPPWQDGHG